MKTILEIIQTNKNIVKFSEYDVHNILQLLPSSIKSLDNIKTIKKVKIIYFQELTFLQPFRDCWILYVTSTGINRQNVYVLRKTHYTGTIKINSNQQFFMPLMAFDIKNTKHYQTMAHRYHALAGEIISALLDISDEGNAITSSLWDHSSYLLSPAEQSSIACYCRRIFLQTSIS